MRHAGQELVLRPTGRGRRGVAAGDLAETGSQTLRYYRGRSGLAGGVIFRPLGEGEGRDPPAADVYLPIPLLEP